MGTGSTLTVGGLFSGIGGFELGFERAGHSTRFLCDNDPACITLLSRRFADAKLHDDVLTLDHLPRVDVITAGIPCTDFSQVGRTAGLGGSAGSLIRRFTTLLKQSRYRPEFIVLENVPFILFLQAGRAVRLLVKELAENGYRWAYRVVDSIAFGTPQRRRRWVLVAARHADPRAVLLAGDAAEEPPQHADAYGFYWTEGTRGLGWACDAVPPLKGGSAWGIPSAPAVWNRNDRSIFCPDITDAERLQGFKIGWSLIDAGDARLQRVRWRLIGNAVNVKLATWIANRLTTSEVYDRDDDQLVGPADRLPEAAHGMGRQIFAANVGIYPVRQRRQPLLEFLRRPGRRLSARATQGFYNRARCSSLWIDTDFLSDVSHHIKVMSRSTRHLR